MRPQKYVRYNHEIVLAVMLYILKLSFGTRKVELYLLIIAVNKL